MNYNEKKVQSGKAVLLDAVNFLKRPHELNIHDKLNRFQKLMDLSEADTKLIHLSLNFHPSEKEKLTPEFLKTLSQEYMEKLGFGNQPFLVYQHFDAGHPHVHIVSTLIRDDGTRINTHNQAKEISEPVRKEMEEKYGLIKADKKENAIERTEALRVSSERVKYGKSETLRSITNVLDDVIDKYKYTSLHELNALLKSYNVMADRGAEGSRVYRNKGLYYRVLDENGHKQGKQIKASDIYSKPTLEYLEKRFKENKLARAQDKKHFTTAIDWHIKQKQGSLQGLKDALKKQSITMEVRRTEAGFVYGLTFISHDKKAVFNGSDLGTGYSAKSILERLGVEQEKPLAKENNKEQAQTKGKDQDKENSPAKQQAAQSPDKSKSNSPMPSSSNSQKTAIAAHEKETIRPEELHKNGNLMQELSGQQSGAEAMDINLKKDEEHHRKRRDQSLER
ncbi:relaxase/mobilization nuclease domain-containing protein [Filimonas effusa]|uniref:relaxase/mobilization nuclease domain-containing protein n=1 Tax=Filimonas effusa TaxID=2508721 RepID=UPI0013E91832